MTKVIISTLFALLLSASLFAQKDSTLIQFSGMILDGSDEMLYPVPYANVLLTEDGRGTYSDLKGFFSIVANKGDVVTFSAIGYKDVEFIIPDTLTDSRYSLVQLMSEDTINLPTAIVFWPSRDHFKLEFLAMDISNDLQERAAKNLATETINRMIEIVPADGNENADFYMRQQAKNYYHIGQTPPMNIFNPFAWKEFLKRGNEVIIKRKVD